MRLLAGRGFSPLLCPMRFRLSLVLGFIACCAALAQAAGLAPVRYTVRFPEAINHYAEIEAIVPTDGQAMLEVFMPVWTPGSYLVREYARNIDRVTAESLDGTALAAEKVSKNRWRIAAGQRDSVRLRYRFYAHEINVRGNWVEPDFALLNGAPTFLAPVAHANRAYEVNVELPAGWQTVQTPLAPTASPTRFIAADYDTLVDSPIVAGSPEVTRFDVHGVAFVLVTIGGEGVWENARVVPSLARVIGAQRELWGDFPTTQPYYFFNALSGARGGLEHKQSTVLMADRWLSRTPGGVKSWLSLASHEYFHTWNGKRLRPVVLGPFDYDEEAYTRSLWVVEGITSYYQHVMMQRAGVTTTQECLGALNSLISSYRAGPGRLVQSLADASFDTWIKAYRPDENTPNTTVSYYSVGSLASFLLDAEIRRASRGTRSLDDVMRVAFERYSGPHGYTDAQFLALVNEVAGADLTPWFERHIYHPGEFDLQPALDWFGLALEDASSDKPARAKAWLGADTKNDAGRLVVTLVKTGTPAQRAGLTPDDEILAVDDYRVRADQLSARLGVYQPGDKITLLVARLDRLRRLQVTLGEEPRPLKLVIRKDSTPQQTAHRNAWLKPDASPAASSTPPEAPTTPSVPPTAVPTTNDMPNPNT